MNNAGKEELTLDKAVTHLLEECRMVLPGLQALFGFQLIVVFNPAFMQELTVREQCIHLGAIGLTAVSVALIMTPAAFHRQTGLMQVTRSFVNLASRLLLWSMFPLILAVCLDFYLVALIILQQKVLSFCFASVLFIFFSTFWFLLPRFKALRGIFA